MEALGAGWTRLPDLPEDAYVLETDDTLLVCPWNLRVRVAEAALNAREGVPPVLADAFVPPVLAGLAKAVVDDWRSGARVLEQGVPRVHEQVATWGVPLRWFVFVDLGERELQLQPGRRALRYRTEISKARRRAHRALSVLRKSRRATRRSPRRSRRRRAGWRSSIRGRWWSSTTAAWSALLADERLRDDDSLQLVGEALAGLCRRGRRMSRPGRTSGSSAGGARSSCWNVRTETPFPDGEPEKGKSASELQKLLVGEWSPACKVVQIPPVLGVKVAINRALLHPSIQGPSAVRPMSDIGD